MDDLPIKPFLTKLSQIKAFKAVLENTLLLYALLIDADVPLWVKAIAISALLYLIDPIDAIPDITPFIGYLDDLTVLISTLKTVTHHVQPHHKHQAELLMTEL